MLKYNMLNENNKKNKKEENSKIIKTFQHKFRK